jgi:RNA polymerase sigma factor (sigma-70 family)
VSERPSTECADNVRVDPALIRTLIWFETQRTGSPVFDEDLEQETAMRILKAIRRVSDIQYPQAFVAKIVRDTVSDYWRKRRSTERFEELPEQFHSYRHAFEEGIDVERMRVRLRTALDRLPDKTRTAIDLFYLKECSVADVATKLHSSPSAAKMALLRGRRELRRMLDEN